MRYLEKTNMTRTIISSIKGRNVKNMGMQKYGTNMTRTIIASI